MPSYVLCARLFLIDLCSGGRKRRRRHARWVNRKKVREWGVRGARVLHSEHTMHASTFRGCAERAHHYLARLGSTLSELPATWPRRR